MSEVARKLGIGRSTLYRKMRDLGLEDTENGRSTA
jgi:transcriptional regulator of acetoin/glycerol metabolism